PDGTTKFWNHASQQLYGYTPKEAIGKNVVDLIIPPEGRDFAEQAIIEMAETGVPIPSSELQMKHKNGTIVDVYSCHTIVKVPGHDQMLFCIDIDLTKHKETEQELFLAEESDRLKSAFLANMSHEIRTPMNGILGFADLLKNPKLSGDEQLKYIGIIEKSGVRMLNIINDIMDISRIEAGMMKLHLSESNINEQCQFIQTFFQPEAEAKGLNLLLRKGLPASELLVMTDKEKLYAILTNLVKNAIKCTPEGYIEFGYQLDEAQKELKFYVKDTGIGIPEESLELIFERFIQSDPSTKLAFQGAGLGLSISKAYVEMLGGRIWVESQMEVGSTFYFTIPYNTELTHKEDLKQIELKTSKSLANQLKILIVEDDEISSILIGLAVEPLASEIIKVKSGVEALEMCKSHPDFDLILMDIQMPVMDGFETTKRIREFNKDVIIIAQTANGLHEDRDKTILAGCTDYVSKPIDKEVLLSLIYSHFKS
ncbi:MAG: ATP-binding protein, partial [Flavobacteriales bacterium]